ncbi:MAG: hypothetical protein S4CHLAM20_00710 [Chlamydiia bacterium]|nr:hypothetical protein [Chlamydiia bacterium]
MDNMNFDVVINNLTSYLEYSTYDYSEDDVTSAISWVVAIGGYELTDSQFDQLLSAMFLSLDLELEDDTSGFSILDLQTLILTFALSEYFKSGFVDSSFVYDISILQTILETSLETLMTYLESNTDIDTTLYSLESFFPLDGEASTTYLSILASFLGPESISDAYLDVQLTEGDITNLWIDISQYLSEENVASAAYMLIFFLQLTLMDYME